MPTGGKIGITEMACLLYISIIGRLFLTFPQSIIEVGGTAAWMVAIISSLGSLLILWLVTLLMKKYPGKTIMDVSEEVLGPYLGTMVNLLFAAYFLILVGLLIRQFGEAMITSTFPDVPISIIIFVFIVAAMSTAVFTMQTLARTARLVTPFVVIGFSLLFVTNTPDINWHYYLPVLGHGPAKIIIEGLKLSIITEALLPAVLAPVFQSWENFRKASFYAMIAGSITLVILIIVYQGVFVYNMAREQTLPFYILARIIELGRFFQRIEAIFLLAWGMVGMIKLAISLYAAAVILTRTFKLPDYRPLLLMSLLLIVALSFYPPDLPSTIELQGTLIYIYGYIPVLVIPAVLYLLSLFRRQVTHHEK